MDIPLKCLHCRKMGQPDDVLLGEFNNHNESLHPDFDYQCRFCPNVFFTPDERKMHEDNDHPKLLCVQCWSRLMTKEFFDPDEFKRHYSTSHPFCHVGCGHCPNCFQATSQKKTHIDKWHLFASIGRGVVRRARGINRPVDCLNCKKSFPSPSELEKHNKARHNDKKFKCPDCSNRFTASSSVVDHVCPFK